MDRIEAQKNLSDRDLVIFNAELGRKQKSPTVAYLLLVFLGGFGAHKFYLSGVFPGILYPILSIFAWWLIIASAAATVTETGSGIGGVMILGLACAVALSLMLLRDLFTIPRQVRRQEDRLREELLWRLDSPAS